MDQDMQKITVEVPRAVLADAQKYVKGGISDAVRRGLEQLAQHQGQLELMKLRGSYKPSISIEEMRSWEDDD